MAFLSPSSSKIIILIGTLLSLIVICRGFFLPSFSNSVNKKPDTIQWSIRDSPPAQYYGHGYSYDSGPGPTSVPLPVPYPVAVPPQPQQQISSVQYPPMTISAAAFQSAYQNMKLVPCLCSVPKDDFEEVSGTIVQGSQKVPEN